MSLHYHIQTRAWEQYKELYVHQNKTEPQNSSQQLPWKVKALWRMQKFSKNLFLLQRVRKPVYPVHSNWTDSSLKNLVSYLLKQFLERLKRLRSYVRGQGKQEEEEFFYLYTHEICRTASRAGKRKEPRSVNEFRQQTNILYNTQVLFQYKIHLNPYLHHIWSLTPRLKCSWNNAANL